MKAPASNLLERWAKASEQLTLSDLHGETLICTNHGIKPPLDPLRAEIERDHPEITLKGVDLPTDTISSVGTSMLNGIAVASVSGVIKNTMIKNRDAIHEAISRLLMERQRR